MSKLRQVSVAELRTGHYIVLPPPWHKHPFLRNHFLLKKSKDLESLSRAGYQHVLVDEEKSLVALPAPAGTPLKRVKETVEPPPDWDPNRLVTPEFRALIRDARLPASQKARAVHQASLAQMKQLMSDPSAARLTEYKAGLAELVDAVLADDAMAASLLSITTHDFYTWTHSVNVGTLSLLFARRVFKGSDAHDLREIAAGFFLHDIGKVRVPADLLNKRGRYSDAEREEMRRHVGHGLDLVLETQVLGPEATRVVAQHHERVDGSGYPRGLKGDEIHPCAMICALADVYDALTSVRPYKTSLSPYEALRVIRREVVGEHNRGLFEAFVRLFFE